MPLGKMNGRGGWRRDAFRRNSFFSIRERQLGPYAITVQRATSVGIVEPPGCSDTNDVNDTRIIRRVKRDNSKDTRVSGVGNEILIVDSL